MPHTANRLPLPKGHVSPRVESPQLAGVALRSRLEDAGWRYDDGVQGPELGGHRVSECCPYTTLVGTPALGYDMRPTYKRKPRAIRTADWRGVRAAAADDLVRRLATLATANPPLALDSHPATAQLLSEPSQHNDRD